MSSIIRLGESPYALDSFAESGGFGEVWRGVHMPSGRQVAIKVVPEVTGSRSSLGRAMMERELVLLSRLEHAHIVKLHDFLHCDARVERRTEGRIRAGSMALVMDWGGESTLADDHGPLEWGTLRSLCLQLLDALAHAHGLGILHLDVKPSNVFVTSAVGWTVALGDFGASLLQGSSSDGRAFHAGTTGFMAPEQERRERWNLQPHTDVYGVGRMLAWLLERHDPVVPDDTREFVARLTAPDPVHRFPTPTHAMSALRTLGAPQRPWSDANPHDPSRTLAPDGLGQPVAFGPGVFTSEVPTTMAVPEEWAQSLSGVQSGGLQSALRARLAHPPLVGRQDVEKRLWDALTGVRRRGDSARIWLRGPLGVGRSRLARELTRRCVETGAARTLTIEYRPHLSLDACLQEAVHVWLGLPSGAAMEDCLQRARQLATQLGMESSLPYLLDLAGGRARGASAAACLAEVLADWGAASWVVVLDDADEHPAAQWLLDQLGETPGTMWIAIGESSAPPGWTDVPVAPLSTGDLRVLAARLIPHHADLQHRLLAQGDRTPLAVVEWLRLWQSNGSFRRSGESWTGPEPVSRSLWEERVGDLMTGHESARLLQAAALLGVSFPIAPLHDMSEATREVLLACVDRELWMPAQDGTWRWSHHALRQWVLARSTPATARWLAEWCARTGQGPRLCARLLEHAGASKEAARRWFEVAESSRGREHGYAALEALERSERLAAALPIEDPIHLDQQVLRALIHHGLGDQVRARELRGEIRATSARHGWARGPVYASWLEARSHLHAGRRGKGLQLLQRATLETEGLEDVLLGARVSFDLGRALISSGDVEAGRQRLERSLEGYLSLGYRSGVQVVAPYLGYALLEQGADAAALDVLERTESWVIPGEDLEACALRARLRAQIYKLRGDHAREEQALLDEQASQPFQRQSLSRLNLALCRLHQEDSESNLLEVQAAITALEAHGAVLHAQIGHALLLPFLAVLDRQGSFGRHLSMAEELCEEDYTSRELVDGLTRAREAVAARGWTPLLSRVTHLLDTVQGRRQA